MNHTKFVSTLTCAVLLTAMTAFHAYSDTVSDAGKTIDKSVTILTETVEAAETDAYTDDTDIAAAVQTVQAGISEAGSTDAAWSSISESGSTDTAWNGVSETGSTNAAGSGSTVLDTTSLFSDRDLEQTADLKGATTVTVHDGETVKISTKGVYVISGTARNAQILVEAGDEDKVQIVLDGAQITNDSTPCIYVKNADKVFVTTTDSENALAVTGTFTADGTTNTDAVIFSRDDVVLNGTGTLTISSTENGISSKDDLKVTGGTVEITCAADALEANESIRIADGTITIKTSKDGLHAENDEDNTTGFVYIGGGTLTVTAGDDAVHATTLVQIDDGTLSLSGAEGIEGTYIRINGGAVSIAAGDDGINAGQKSNISTPTVEVNGGEITIAMGAGDTDAVDSNGNLLLNGGTLNITAQSPFDYDGTAENNGATIIVNGTQTDTITNQMMGGHGGGNPFFGGKQRRW